MRLTHHRVSPARVPSALRAIGADPGHCGVWVLIWTLVLAHVFADVDALINQGTARHPCVVQYIRMQGDAGRPDYQRVDMRRAEINA